MIELPRVTLVALTDQNIEEHIEALCKSMQGIEFGRVLLLSPRIGDKGGNFISEEDEGLIHGESIEPLGSIDAWNKAVIQELPKHIPPSHSHAILIHHDGHIIHPHLWKDEWLEYDWCSSPWPLPQDDYSYRSESGKIQRVGNSVSLRSKRLMELVATRPWKSYYGNTNEDGFTCCHNREWLEEQGMKFMPFEESIHFGKEAPLPENEGIDTFLFHKYP